MSPKCFVVVQQLRSLSLCSAHHSSIFDPLLTLGDLPDPPPPLRRQIVASFRVTSGASNTTALKTIEFARRGECFLVNSVDRVIRVYDARRVLAAGVDGDPEPVQKLQDQVGGREREGGLGREVGNGEERGKWLER